MLNHYEVEVLARIEHEERMRDLERRAQLQLATAGQVRRRALRDARPVARAWRRAVAALGLLALLAACGRPAANVPAATATLPAATAVAPTATAAPPTAQPSAAGGPPTATSTPAATSLASPSPSQAATPTRAAASARPSAAAVVVDEHHRCQLAVPAGYKTESELDASFVSDDNEEFASIASFDGGALTLEDTASLFVGTFSSFFTGYEETYRSGGKLSGGREELVINFDVLGEEKPLRGQFYFLQTGATVCGITYMRVAPANSDLVNVPDPIVDGLDLIKP